MLYRKLIIGLAVLAAPSGDALALDGKKYPHWTGQWERFVVRGLPGQPSFDQTKPWGFGQHAPLTAEYQKILENSILDQANGGLGNYYTPGCLAAGMPHMIVTFRPLEFIITPATTYILIGSDDHYRQIFTDGRDWPKEIEPTFSGYSIGRWIDEDADGRYDVLEVETRGPFKGPRSYNATGLPLHFDNPSIFKERLPPDKSLSPTYFMTKLPSSTMPSRGPGR